VFWYERIILIVNFISSVIIIITAERTTIINHHWTRQRNANKIYIVPGADINIGVALCTARRMYSPCPARRLKNAPGLFPCNFHRHSAGAYPRRTRMTIQRDKKGSSERPRETDGQDVGEGRRRRFLLSLHFAFLLRILILLPTGIYGSQIGTMNDGRYYEVPSSRMNISVRNATIEMWQAYATRKTFRQSIQKTHLSYIETIQFESLTL